MKTFSALRIFSFAAIAAALTACGGANNGGLTPPAPLSRTSAPTSDNQLAMLADSPGTLTISANIVALFPGGFEVQGGKGVGYLHVYTNSSTSFVGAKPYVGEIVEASGTGSAATSMTAAKVTQLLQVSGPVLGLVRGGYEVQGGKGIGSLNVYTNSATVYAGGRPVVGGHVTALGTGSYATSMTAVLITNDGKAAQATPAPKATAAPKHVPTPAPTAAPTAAPVVSSPSNEPAPVAFMSSSWGKVSAMQVFDETSNGYVAPGAASADGARYSAIWGARPGIESDWSQRNPTLETAYYNALETDPSSTGWGAIGHPLSWWKQNHPDWVLYACNSSGSATSTPAYIPGLNNNVPLDIHNPAVVEYQIRAMADYAHSMGYHALAIDEATFWQADEGVSGGYGCGIYQNGSFVRRYTGVTDPNWTADVIAWVKIAHSMLTTDPAISSYHLKLIVNHPADKLTADETEFLANVDADLNENGYTYFGNYHRGSANDFLTTVNWSTYAQQHGVAVLTDDNWGNNSVGTAQLDYSIATYLMGNEQAEALYASPGSGFGTEQWHSQYQAAIGAPCGEHYSAGDGANPSIYYRRFANAIVVVNGGSGSNNEVAHLPSGHTYTDLFGRRVSNPLSIASNDGYVLMTSNGCH